MEVACYQYFSGRIKESKSKIEEDVLYLADGGFQFRHYIGLIKIFEDSINESCIFIEFVSKITQQDLGLPAILEKSHAFSSPLTKNYSYAFYKDGILNDWKGKYDYKQKLSDYHLITYHDAFFEKDHYQHYIYSKSPGNVLVISLEEPGILQKLASFAFVFLFYSLLTFLLYTYFKTSSLKNSFSNFQGRLQYSMIILLLFSFVLIGVSSLYYIIYLNQQKNADNLMEKAHSVLIELEHKLTGMEQFNEEDKLYVESLLAKFSEVFFTDITLFTREGNLLASSRPQVFQSELLSQNINAYAYYQLSVLKNSFFIQNEQIGTQQYLSAYLPFRNQDNQSVAYLNLPYFAKQYELEDEVSGFVVAFLNIYLFLLFIAIMITIIISRYLSRPLLLVKEKISKINLQQDNEKIDWNKNDEIGDLVKEYNRMVDELEESAHKLAISQRESAWREMAQQIAHEIKNPLTPMKLNVQYLEKAWDDQVEDYEERMKRITKALKEQIDALSEIAGQFGTFAAIEKIAPQKLDIKSIIENVTAVFKVNEHIHFELQLAEEDCMAVVDKNQIIRVFNNIYKNAVQALSQQPHPQITTKCIVENGFLKISIQDNGVGIPPKELAYIFEPRFTTKTGGMGLGLALVKKMLENANASIDVISEEAKGTTFSILIPMVKH
jgi:nitrogen fixation/metabolism regulation signal transduction histidine kinase